MNKLRTIVIVSVLFLFLVLIIVLATVPRCAQNITESSAMVRCADHFTNVYTNWSNQLKDMKKTHQIGAPSGLLKYRPQRLGEPCSSADSGNLLVQPDVAFKPHRRNNGCTYIDLKYPG